ncbi:helix-turn-helix domain-containing protein [Actinosynnema mirum]|uniref:helix-turn-helix domain-containing protein n=1 Tax=Actinosynnema mirum TaxID=40567 RepID=UPI003CCB29CA
MRSCRRARAGCDPRVHRAGFAALDPERGGGRPRAIGEAVRERIRLITRTSPASWGITAFSTWSLSKLRDHLLDRGTVAASSRCSTGSPCAASGTLAQRPGRAPPPGRPPPTRSSW